MRYEDALHHDVEMMHRSIDRINQPVRVYIAITRRDEHGLESRWVRYEYCASARDASRVFSEARVAAHRMEEISGYAGEVNDIETGYSEVD